MFGFPGQCDALYLAVASSSPRRRPKEQQLHAETVSEAPGHNIYAGQTVVGSRGAVVGISRVVIISFNLSFVHHKKD